MKKFIYTDNAPLYVTVHFTADGKKNAVDVVANKGDVVELPEGNKWVMAMVGLGRLQAVTETPAVAAKEENKNSKLKN